MRIASALASLAVLAALGAATTAAASAPPRNLVATPAVQAQLRASFLQAHPRWRSTAVRGPLRGRTYYGSAGGRFYAVATFSVPFLGSQGQPETFRRAPGRRWLDLGDTGGDVCPPTVPLALLRLWGFVPSAIVQRRGGATQCYAPPPTR